ncbi:N-acetylmuramoyl-L-alanine amidase [[Actinomadura] parvosata subsp. kistnae]|uniref:hypothetical protein n=1 Tax=[Actinomadura] parvosata TaxID=1955412 RepID=UPI000D29F2F2|nr:N-acetylmuramoyl-L-alanine amidase [Actinomadura parvosata subsp. kistnae]
MIGAVVVQANSKEAPVVAVGNSASESEGGSGAGQPGEGPSEQQPPPVAQPTDSAAPVPTLDIEPEETKKTRKPTKEPIAQVPDPVTQAPRPQTTTKKAEPTPTPTKTKKKSTTLIEPEVDPARSPSPTPKTSKTPSSKTSAKPEAALKPNTYSPAAACGSGYKIINSHALGDKATVYLLYSSSAGKNCVVTMSRYVYPNKTKMSATLQVQGGATGGDNGAFTAYAGPVRLAAAKKCVMWGGAFGALSWKSGWSHCG